MSEVKLDAQAQAAADDPVDPPPPDPKAERAQAIADAQAKAAALKAAQSATTTDYDARLQAAVADDTAPIPTIADLDYFALRRKQLLSLVETASAVRTAAVNYQTDTLALLARGEAVDVKSWDVFVAAFAGGGK